MNSSELKLRVAIHQPDFLPWLGFFNKIANSDTWIVLDHVKNNPRDAAFWGRRVKILVNKKPYWLGVKLEKPKIKNTIGIPINEMRIESPAINKYSEKLHIVRNAYTNAPFFDIAYPLVEAYFMDEDDNLARRNMKFIRSVMNLLEINTKIIFSSEMSIETNKTQLLIDLLKKINATTYVCGGGADGYQQDLLFQQNGIELKYNNFKHPVYKQGHNKDFEQGLSVLDSLFWLPSLRVSEIIHNSNL